MCVCVCMRMLCIIFLCVYASVRVHMSYVTYDPFFTHFRSHSADVMFNPDDASVQSAILDAVLKVR